MRLFNALCFLSLICILYTPQALLAQEGTDVDANSGADTDTVSAWTTGGNVGVTFNQVALSNWAGGGDNTFSVGSNIGLSATMVKKKQTWNNALGFAYGFTKIKDEDFRKSDDKLTFLSKYDYNATQTLLYSFLLDFRTQITEGLDYENLDSLGEPTKISNALAPGYLTLSLGATWRPTNYFEAFVAPVSNRLTIVVDDELNSQGEFGVDTNKTIKSELGATGQLRFQNKIMENVSLKSNLNIFAAYETFTKAVITWETLLNLKVNDYITTSISLDVIYDEAVEITRDDGTVGPSTQIKEALNIGFGYQF